MGLTGPVPRQVVNAIEARQLGEVRSTFQVELQFLVTRKVANLFEQEASDDGRKVDTAVVISVLTVVFAGGIEFVGANEADEIL